MLGLAYEGQTYLGGLYVYGTAAPQALPQLINLCPIIAVNRAARW